ncbi:phosphoribosylpyrophosphate synthetase [Mucilaginibacter terrae]|uniref:Phosphoribosylpyrophosphate synthetase n=1 Tax=Mucilaginibacter terrae TaxID=1955052 RepID=A0ABU3GZY0_9SPHI|nr:phosphoribosylpyrophosphate synthetase [Mucilaginibacter terrae]MDT3405313.1 hypothetical protein [Mucilaginibacter terrae]
MKTFDTLIEALNDLRSNGYDLDFNLKENYLDCPQLSKQFYAEEFHVDKVYRFEGETDPSDSSILYGISTIERQKGVLVEAYGAYATTADEALIKKLRIDMDTMR